jgi:uncharacterized membrane protein YeaQ/YmgE (transglycosylase-associated protein family)
MASVGTLRSVGLRRRLPWALGIMKRALRFPLSIGGGIAAAVLIWANVSAQHPIFAQLAMSGFVPEVLAGVVGGFVSAVLAPSHKIRVALGCGSLLAALLLAFLLRHGPSHLGRNPFLWYWPAYLPAYFALGGYLGRRLWLDAQPVAAADGLTAR